MLKDLWLDLELRKDIDDYATLVFALETKRDIAFLSVNDPSLEEIRLFNYTIEKFGLDLTLIISGEIKEYEGDENIHSSLMELIDGYEKADYIHIDDLSDRALSNYAKFDKVTGYLKVYPITVFCGGSLTTLSILIERFDNEFLKACIQGGFASYEIVEKEFLLKKFKKRKKVPTWNLNLDIEATRKVLNSSLNISFVSKNICHDSWVSFNDLNDGNSFFNIILKRYFETNSYNSDKKCMHDLLAFLSIESDIVGFKKVNLLFTEDERPKFWSELNNDSTFSISVSFEKKSFIDKIKSI